MEKGKMEQKIKLSNEIKDISNYKQLSKINLDLDSPRLRKAMFNLGITDEELTKKDREDFEQKGVPKDVIDLRYKVCTFYIYLIFLFPVINSQNDKLLMLLLFALN